VKKFDAARKLAECLRGIHKKSDELERVSGFSLCEFLTEINELENLLLDILVVPPWDLDRSLVLDYIWNEADYDFDDMLEKVEDARRNFDPDAYEEFCDEHERCYGRRP